MTPITYNSDEVFAVIENIAQTPGKNDKQEFVRDYLQDAEFARVIVAALDPFTTYGIAKVPERTTYGAGYFNEGGDTWKILAGLASRKLSGDAARAAVQEEINRLSEPSSQLFRRIIKKDLRAGFGESTVNKAKPGLIPDFPYMRCCLPKDAKLDKFDWAKGVYSQEKADGMFVNVDVDQYGGVTLTTRQGSPLPVYELGNLECAISKTLKADTQSHGEMIILKAGKVLPREQGNGALNSVLKGGSLADDEMAVLLLWDQIPRSAVKTKGKHSVGYALRFADLKEQVATKPPSAPIGVVQTRVVRSLEEAYAHYAELLAQGKEGTVVKHPNAIWKDGTSKEQAKLKLEAECELEITGFVPGEGKNADTFGSISCKSSCGELEVNVSGFTDAARREIHSAADGYIGTIMTVRANAIMRPSREDKPHSLFLPRFVEFRGDKRTADSLQRINEQFEAAIRGGA